MRKEAVTEAITEAKRFLKRAHEYEKVMADRRVEWEHPIECGALRRASLDLTRALARMRKP